MAFKVDQNSELERPEKLSHKDFIKVTQEKMLQFSKYPNYPDWP